MKINKKWKEMEFESKNCHKLKEKEEKWEKNKKRIKYLSKRLITMWIQNYEIEWSQYNK